MENEEQLEFLAKWLIELGSILSNGVPRDEPLLETVKNHLRVLKEVMENE